MSAQEQPPPPYPGDGDTSKGAYPPATGYPPQQPGYPPQQPGYPAQQPGYPPQQPGYPPQAGSYQQSTAMVINQPTAVATIVQQYFGDLPANTTCPNCQNQVTTQVTHEPGSGAWLFCFLFFLFGLWCCCFIPFCVDSMQNANHHCPVCKYRIATYTR